MDLSLDEIIMTKHIGGPPRRTNGEKTGSGIKNKVGFKPARVRDARNKIIQSNRGKIRDARDKIAEITRTSGMDVRERLSRKNQLDRGHNGVAKASGYRLNGRLAGRKMGNVLPPKRGPSHPPMRMGRPVGIPAPEMVIPRGYVDYDNMEEMEEEEYATATRLSRTVKNDMSPFVTIYDTNGPRSNGPHLLRRHNSWSSQPEPFDPFDVYEVPAHERRHELPPPPPKGILRPSMRQHSPPRDFYERHYMPDSSHLSYEMRTRLERAPDPHASMGIFSNPLKPAAPSMSMSASASGYRIVVSNLHTSVTQPDIKELFEDIGSLYDSRIVRPGVAEVIFKTLKDAEKAVDTYHNRQLDGLPMKCLLVNPRSSNKPTAPAIKTSSSISRVQSGKTPLEIDIDALHKVLFRRH